MRPPPDGFVLTQWGDWRTEQGLSAVRSAAAAGARHVSVIVELRQSNATDHDLVFARPIAAARARDFEASHQSERLRELARHLPELGLELGILPIVFAGGLADRQWIRPREPARWFDNYTACLVSLARTAESLGARELVLASELSLLFLRRRPWLAVIDRVRREFSGHVTLSAVAPQYRFVRVFEALDSLGVSAYFPLSLRRSAAATDLAARWRLHRAHLLSFARRLGKPLTFVEVGYPATRAAAARPWNYDFEREGVDFELQRRCFAAFAEVWAEEPLLRSFRIWGLSASECSHPYAFEPLGKPAEAVVRELFRKRAELALPDAG
jgi:hypothetical protein